eukprot:9497096-Pyramimonas_sp.AAC.3
MGDYETDLVEKAAGVPPGMMPAAQRGATPPARQTSSQRVASQEEAGRGPGRSLAQASTPR